MKIKLLFNSADIVFFKRWQNKGFSILNTFKKIIIILALPVAYLTLSFNYAFSQIDTVNISGILIKSPKKSVFSNQTAKFINIISFSQIKKLPSNNLSDLIDGSTGVDLMNRGASGVQADFSIRGGNFDQVLFLLNGIPVSDPQTGHNSFVLPVPTALVKRIEILQGPGSRLFGLGAYSGAINFVTKQSNLNKTFLNFSYAQYFTPALNFYNLSGKNDRLSSLSFSFKHSNGYSLNSDFSVANFFLKETLKKDNYIISLQTSLNAKKYGAYNFYTPYFPYQYEILFKNFNNLTINFGNKLKNKLNFYYNFHFDRFELFREGDNWYKKIDDFWIKNNTDTAKFSDNYKKSAYYSGHNHHFSQTGGILYSSFFNSFLGKTNYGINIKFDKILSNVLGYDIDSVLVTENIVFTNSAKRFNYNFFIEQSKKIGKFSVSAGSNLIYNKKFGFFPVFGSDFLFNANSFNKLYFSANQGVRIPTFTDLFYNGPSNIGNDSLKPEKATTYEIGYKLFRKSFSFKVATFYRVGKNSIDWVKFNQSEKWKTMNYTHLNTLGFEFSANKYFNYDFLNYIRLNYTYLYQEKPEKDVISKYSLNYLKHNFALSVNHNFFRDFYFSWQLKYQYRNGYYYFIDDSDDFIREKYKSYWLIDAKLSYKLQKISFYLQGSNLLNEKYYDLSYVKLPGIWISCGINIKL